MPGAELDDTVAAGFLRFHQSAVGPAEHGLGSVAGLDFRHAKRGRDRTGAQARLSGLLEFVPDLLRPLRDRGVVTVCTQHDELFSAVSGHQVALAAGTLQKSGETDQGIITSLMTERVIDALEVVDVAHDQSTRQAAFEMMVHKLGVNAIEFGPVGHLGQRVTRGLHVERLDAFLERNLGGGVVQQAAWRRT